MTELWQRIVRPDNLPPRKTVSLKMEPLYSAILGLLEDGHVLTSDDIAQIHVALGGSENTSVGDLLTPHLLAGRIDRPIMFRHLRREAFYSYPETESPESVEAAMNMVPKAGKYRPRFK